MIYNSLICSTGKMHTPNQKQHAPIKMGG